MKYLLCIVLMGYSSLGNAQDFATKVTETFTENVKVSGGSVIGAMIWDSDQERCASADDSHIKAVVYVPEALKAEGDPAHQNICLHLTSMDGKYRGLFEAALNRASAMEPNSLIIDTEYQKELRHYLPDRLTILATVEESCRTTSPKVAYVPAGWCPAGEDGKVLIQVNSLAYRTSLEVHYPDEGTKSTVICSASSEKYAAGYNRTCAFERKNASAAMKIKIINSEPGERDRPVLFDLRF